MTYGVTSSEFEKQNPRYPLPQRPGQCREGAWKRDLVAYRVRPQAHVHPTFVAAPFLGLEVLWRNEHPLAPVNRDLADLEVALGQQILQNLESQNEMPY